VKSVKVVVAMLLKRLMWPKKDDQVAIYQNGKLVAEGHVILSNEREITVFGKNASAVNFTASELSRGIDDGSIVVKKRNATV
jgi:hypothetical protein